MKRALLPLVLIGIIIIGISCGRQIDMQKESVEYVTAELNKFAPVSLESDVSFMDAKEVEVLKLLVKAARIMDDIFLDQVYAENHRILSDLKKGPADDPWLGLFRVMYGPWNRLDKNHIFLGDTPKPAGANYYPEDMTADEFHAWLEAHPDMTEAFESNFTMIRRDGDGLKAVPYAEFFNSRLQSAADYLNRAADITADETLARFLRSRAASFLSNDYYQSDMDWMDLAGDIEVVIGPYEVYEDNLFGYKAAFESFICVVDHQASEEFKKIGTTLNDLEDNLPIPDRHKNFSRGASSPIKVVNEIFAAGDTKAGAQTLAFNLPNDERVREAKGSKKVMLRNVMKAKFEKILTPIVAEVLTEACGKQLSFDAYFKHILLHEVSHGLGPGRIIVKGRETTVNRELKDVYSVIEEAKADVVGLYSVQRLIDTGVMDPDLEATLYETNLGGMFRSIRFGIEEAHGGGVAIQLNYYLDKGAVKVDETGRFYVVKSKIKQAVRDLAGELLMIEAEGDYSAAVAFIERYVTVLPEVQAALDRLGGIPVDIRPSYPLEADID
ncbi:peptidase [bacterium]|nr:peptidase [bacterium]